MNGAGVSRSGRSPVGANNESPPPEVAAVLAEVARVLCSEVHDDGLVAIPDAADQRHRVAACYECQRAAAALAPILAAERARGAEQAWDEGYVAGQAFGYEYAQDTYDGPSEDPTTNPYADRLAALTPGAEVDRG